VRFRRDDRTGGAASGCLYFKVDSHGSNIVRTRRHPMTEVPESRKSRAGRHGRRSALYLGAALLTTALVLLVILIVQNTGRVRVGWIFGHSRVSLVFLILFAAILGWVAGMATSIVFRRRTRRP
jgi:uncharacterized integral membrane protein